MRRVLAGLGSVGVAPAPVIQDRVTVGPGVDNGQQVIVLPGGAPPVDSTLVLIWTNAAVAGAIANVSGCGAAWTQEERVEAPLLNEMAGELWVGLNADGVGDTVTFDVTGGAVTVMRLWSCSRAGSVLTDQFYTNSQILDHYAAAPPGYNTAVPSLGVMYGKTHTGGAQTWEMFAPWVIHEQTATNMVGEAENVVAGFTNDRAYWTLTSAKFSIGLSAVLLG